jgi:hypothetical protein
LGGGEQSTEAGAAQQAAVRPVIRFASAPDPLFSYLKDTGELAVWEEQHNLRIVMTESWDTLEYFRGGHGDVAFIGSYEMPMLEQTSTKAVAFGKFSHQHVPMLRSSRANYETLADVPDGATVCANSGMASTIPWSVIADQVDGVDYRLGEGKFNMILQDHHEMPKLVQDDECTVAAAIPEGAAPQLRRSELEPMYGGRAPWRIYQEDICRCDHKGVMSKLFVARQEWLNANPAQAEALLELWERGLQLWRENREEIVTLYPDFYTAPADEDTEYLLDYIEDNDWYADTVYLDERWIDGEKKFFDYMIESGWMEPDAELPQFEVVGPPA